MKVRGFLTALSIVSLIGIFVFGITPMVYAKAAPDATDAAGVQVMPPAGEVDPETKGPDKGSPMHAWKAIVNAGKKAGDTITAQEFAGMRNWSARTRGYELQSLVAIGVLAMGDQRGEYRLLVNATAEQIDQVNVQARSIVNKKGKDGTELGIDSYRLDANYLGEGKPEEIAGVVGKVIGAAVTPGQVSANFVQADMEAGIALPASVAINGSMAFTVNSKSLADVDEIADETEQQALLAALVDTGIASAEADSIEENVVNFSVNKVKTKTLMFKEEFVAAEPAEFKKVFDSLESDVIAVIVAINMNNGEIIKALMQAGLLEQWGSRIVVMGVVPESPAAVAFGRLFGDRNIIDLRGQSVDDILRNKDLVEGLKGAV